MSHSPSRAILAGHAQGPILATQEPISFWGGIDPATGLVIDVHHPLHGQSVAGAILMMPSTRGSCTGSGVLLDLALNGKAPAALVFSQAEDVATLGALIAGEMFDRPLPVLRLSPPDWQHLCGAGSASITAEAVTFEGGVIRLSPKAHATLALTPKDEAILAGANGVAAQLALRVICTMAENQGARDLVDVVQGHIDGCIYASPANLTFAEKMVDLGAQVVIPTTMNAISVDRENWQAQGVPPVFGGPAARLADAYLRMGCQKTFTCSPYLLETAPREGEMIAWAESNAVIYANSVIGARTAKHPDFLDLFIAMTGRAPRAGVYLDAERIAQKVLRVSVPAGADDAFWPLIGYLAGQASPDAIPVIEGLESAGATPEALKALCAAFGTSSAAPMLHVAGVTPEAHLRAEGAPVREITRADMIAAWEKLNAGPEAVGLVAIGSPHASYEECARFEAALAGRKVVIPSLITAGRAVIRAAEESGLLGRLDALGVTVLPDLCWCSISEPVFPPEARALITNSGKYAHYGPGLSGRAIRFAGLNACADAATTGHAPKRLPDWLA